MHHRRRLVLDSHHSCGVCQRRKKTVLRLWMALMSLVATRLGIVQGVDSFVDLTELLQLRLDCLVRSGQIDCLVEGQHLGILVEYFLSDGDVSGAVDDLVHQVVFKGGAIEVALLRLLL